MLANSLACRLLKCRRRLEITARLGLGAPEYVVRSEGPDHAKRFFATVVVDGRVIGDGSGRSKKAAEQQAATAACAALLAPGVD